jgi:hypothetical protein
MRVYVVAEGQLDAAILRTLLKAASFDRTFVAAGGGKSAAISLANSIALSRNASVAVVLDADTSETRIAKEQEDTFRSLQSKAITHSEMRLFLAIPTLEEALFRDAETFSQVFRLNLSPQQRHSFETNRMDVIRLFVNPPDTDEDTHVQPGGEMDIAAAKRGFDNPLLQDLWRFIRSAHG